MSKKILIVDDSALVRKQLKDLIAEHDFEIETAKNGQDAIDKALKTNYDVITMDVNMPVLDGLSAVKEIMQKNPTPILMVSSLTSANASVTVEAMEYGAIDFILKPGTMNVGVEESGRDIVQKIKSLSRISKRRLKVPERVPEKRRERSASPQALAPCSTELDKVVLIGVSTGGPGLIEQIVSSLPVDYPLAVCIVQHMPAQFTRAFAERLARVSDLPVHESSNNDEVLPGHIYLARGGVHMHFRKKTSGKIVTYDGVDKNSRFFQPSVDEMFESALKVFPAKKIFAVLLTGIGDDGADGMLEIKKAGGYTVAESEASAIVYGMPKVAFERGGTSEVLDFIEIKKKILSYK
ncbi:MAG: chemotaxis response regulator protein-glutamate methylesterase [Campylobacterales bacterium]|nr:chemotaxis response regulator protein-glutamate methylesterase [Campylobacterales bacterium]MBE0499529.1 chemotaxis response regulator protein-glutamate methylesterase [Campylobacterales bacterium]